MTSPALLIDPPPPTPGPAPGPHDHHPAIATSCLSPQEQLNRGIIHTEISRPLAAAITIGFLIIIAAIPLAQAAIDYRRQGRIQALELFHHFPTTANLH